MSNIQIPQKNNIDILHEKVYGTPDTRKYKVEATTKQIKTVNAIVAGEGSVSKAMEEAVYSPQTSHNPKQNFVASRGVQSYLKTLDIKSQQKFNMSVADKALETYLNAMEAVRYIPIKVLNQGNKIEYKTKIVPDHDTRIKAADRIITLYRVANEDPRKIQEEEKPKPTQDEINDFNEKFLKFVNSEYFT